MLGTKKQTYTYQPIVRTPVGEDGQPDPNKHPYMKIKLLTEFPSNLIRTSVVEQTDNGRSILKTDTQSINEFDEYFRLRTNIRCMVAPVKL